MNTQTPIRNTFNHHQTFKHSSSLLLFNYNFLSDIGKQNAKICAGRPQKCSGKAHGPQNEDMLSHVEHGPDFTINVPFTLTAGKTHNPQPSWFPFALSGE